MYASLIGSAIVFSSCSKSESVNVAQPEFTAGQVVTGTTLSGSVKGTVKAGTYYFSDDITVNEGDTLILQSGVNLLSTMKPGDSSDPPKLIIKGAFFSLGSKEKPNYITGQVAFENPSAYKLSKVTDPNTDPALMPNGKMWGGIQCDVSCKLLIIKWTHLDFAGGNVGQNPIVGYKEGKDLFVTLFQNPDGIFIMEDSWIYGSTTDAARVKGGKISFMRNTIEKLAYNDGDAFNVKGGTVGDMAYNFFIGTAKGGTKASNKGIVAGASQTNVNMYNNTYINGGWRSVDPDRGANVDYEEGAKGMAYNNIMVNCKTGLRILGNPAADVANMHYGYNLSYGDSANVVNQFYPPTHVTKPQDTDIPKPSTFLPSDYTLGMVYDGSKAIGVDDPKFVNYPLPNPDDKPLLRSINYVGNYDFHLDTSSPAIGAGYTNFSPIDPTSSIVTNEYLKANITMPNADLGCYPTDGTGNQH